MSDTSTKGPLAMTTDRDDIASCPFCGGEAKLRRLVEKYPAEGEHPAGEYDAWFYINCDDCGIEVGDEYESGAIEAWNRRAPSASMGRVTVKALEWASEPPYSVARVPRLWLFYSTEAVWDDRKFCYAELSGGLASGRFETVAAAKAAAQADYEARILAALDSPPGHGGGEGSQP